MNQELVDKNDYVRNNLTDRPTDRPVSCIRLVAFSFIVTCHIQQYLGNGLCWWFNVGVQIFLAISGFLYGGKIISDEIRFYKRKFKQILLPYYITVVAVIVVQLLFFRELLNLKIIIKVLLCNDTLSGGEHLWFIPTILMCYFLTPVFQKYIYSTENIFSTLTKIVVMVFVAFELFFTYFNSAWIVCYFFGYVLGYVTRHGMLKEKKILEYAIISMAFAFNFTQILFSYIIRIGFDGIYKSGFQLFCDYAHTFLGIAIFIILRRVFQKFLENGCLSGLLKIIKLSDQYSYEGYLVHQFFILGPMTMMEVTKYMEINIIIIIMMTLFCAFLLKNAEIYYYNGTQKKGNTI